MESCGEAYMGGNRDPRPTAQHQFASHVCELLWKWTLQSQPSLQMVAALPGTQL